MYGLEAAHRLLQSDLCQPLSIAPAWSTAIRACMLTWHSRNVTAAHRTQFSTVLTMQSQVLVVAHVA